jgi:hypothetical protein
MKMKHFGVIKCENLITVILFLVMWILLLMGFTLNLSVVEELQGAANFNSFKIFILLAGIDQGQGLKETTKLGLFLMF